LHNLCRSKFPLILIHRTPPDYLKIPFVTVENKTAARKIISHLIEEHDRRSILFYVARMNRKTHTGANKVIVKR
jgi:DNA-binding LacI/PurR family transcriptional regulator